MKIGIDFDNTIAGYDKLFLKLAQAKGFVGADFVGGKRAVRDHLRAHISNGEIEWQYLQGEAYGPAMAGAEIIAGVADFLNRAKTGGHEVFIISHKTEFANYGDPNVSLREAARAWMNDQGFFDADGYGLTPENVSFHTTRAQKVARVTETGVVVFIDDLEEVFAEPTFPSGVEQLLFHPAHTEAPAGAFTVCDDWKVIEHHVFDSQLIQRRA